MDESQEEKNQRVEPFKKFGELREFMGSTNIETIYQGILRFRQLLYIPPSTEQTANASTENNLKIFREYLQASPECSDLFRIWDLQQKHNITKIEVLIVDLLAKVIDNTNIAAARASGNSIIKRILTNYMKIIYRNLGGRIPLCQATLKMLVAMNSHSLAMTRELTETFHFGHKSLGRLLNIRLEREDGKSRNKIDVRTLYVRFILSFLIRGDFVDEVLRTIYDRVILETDLDRKTKINFFTGSVLDHLLRLFACRDPAPSDPSHCIADLVHNFLRSLCCTPGVGICFQDLGWYPHGTVATQTIDEEREKSVKVYNIVLSKFITKLKPIEDLRQQDLLLRILEACPELVPVFWQSTKLTFEPRLSSTWLSTMSLLQKIVFLPVPSLKLPNARTYLSSPPPCSTIIENILPSAVNRIAISKGLQHSSLLVRFTTAISLGFLFQKLDNVSRRFGEIAASIEIIDTANARRWNDIPNSLAEEMRRRVPDVQVLLKLHHDILAAENLQKGPDDEETMRNKLMREAVLRLIKFYQKYIPDSLFQSKFDMGRLIPADFNRVAVGLVLHLLDLLFAIDGFPWWNKNESDFSHLISLINLYISTPYPQVKEKTAQALRYFMTESILFQHDPNESEIFLNTIQQTLSRRKAKSDKIELFKFLDSRILQYRNYPYKDIDRTVKLTKNVKDNLVNANSMDVDNANESKELVEIARQKLSVRYNTEEDEFEYPFSPLLITIVDYNRQTTNPTSVVSEFISNLIRNMRRSGQQRDKISATPSISELYRKKVLSEDSISSFLDTWKTRSAEDLDRVLLLFIKNHLPEGLDEPTEDLSLTSILSVEKRLHATIPKDINDDVFYHLTNNMNDTRISILRLLILCKSQFRKLFKNCIRKEFLNMPTEKLVSLIDAYLSTVAIRSNERAMWFEDSATDDDRNAISFIGKMYGKRLLAGMQVSLNSQSPSLVTLVFRTLLDLEPTALLKRVTKDLIHGDVSSVFGLDYLTICDHFFKYYGDNVSGKQRKDFVTACLHHIALLLENNALDSTPIKTFDMTFQKLESILKNVIPLADVLEANTVGEFVFVAIDKKIAFSSVIKCITSLISAVYSQPSFIGPPPNKILDAILSHSQFTTLTYPSMLSSKSSYSQTRSIRLALCHLIHRLYDISPSICCRQAYLPFLIEIYGATTADSDRLLLDIFIKYEKITKVSVIMYLMTWGPGSSDLITKKRLMGENVVVESMGLLDAMTLMQSYTHFKIDDGLEVAVENSLIEERIGESEERIKMRAAPICDLSFMLTLFANLMSYGSMIDCRRFIEVNALGLVIVSLSSNRDNVRRAAYYLLDEFYVLLERAMFREKKQILLLLNALKNAITERESIESPQRIPTIITVFVALSLTIFLNPAHTMYPLINRFLLQRPIIDLEDVPMFYQLMYSSSSNSQKDRVWILRLLSAGLKSFSDYKLFKRRYVWDIISGYYISRVSDNVTRKIINEIIFQAASIPNVINDMVIKNGLLAWIHSLCISTTLSPDNQFCFVGPRILLRVLQGCKKTHSRWQEGIWSNQALCIATDMLHLLDGFNVTTSTSLWTLNMLKAILHVFHYIALASPPTALTYNTHQFTVTFRILEKCELYLDPCLKAFRIVTKVVYQQPCAGDNLDQLYVMNDDGLYIYKELVRMVFEMVVNCEKLEGNAFKKITARALAIGVSNEARSWMIECLGLGE
ncbi:1637_t:CDS:10 [Paraglomus occultum]|uniref:1637_t:CDS:1 n=1 Tax=Paraglomus occultum TaxID=144539 RepID=A0A9N9BX54_9GLOM|nr:1637_t:CDS:10 [Paraglomus occultum]